jgi:hypothetical protein
MVYKYRNMECFLRNILLISIMHLLDRLNKKNHIVLPCRLDDTTTVFDIQRTVHRDIFL